MLKATDVLSCEVKNSRALLSVRPVKPNFSALKKKYLNLKFLYNQFYVINLKQFFQVRKLFIYILYKLKVNNAMS